MIGHIAYVRTDARIVGAYGHTPFGMRFMDSVQGKGVDQHAEYFFALPRTCSAGYFTAFFSSLCSAASSKFTSSLSERRTRYSSISANSSATAGFFCRKTGRLCLAQPLKVLHQLERRLPPSGPCSIFRRMKLIPVTRLGKRAQLVAQHQQVRLVGHGVAPVSVDGCGLF